MSLASRHLRCRGCQLPVNYLYDHHDSLFYHHQLRQMRVFAAAGDRAERKTLCPLSTSAVSKRLCAQFCGRLDASLQLQYMSTPHFHTVSARSGGPSTGQPAVGASPRSRSASLSSSGTATAALTPSKIMAKRVELQQLRERVAQLHTVRCPVLVHGACAYRASSPALTCAHLHCCR